ncbi:MAG: hypothetical protein HYX53_17880 [Chloroflexi bacterium]|nr:hypothetical protein [Chloroflexota bacterium]
MTTATLPSGTGVVSTYTYDNADRLTAISHDKGGTTLASATYTLDNAGNRTQKVDLAGTETYSYDNAYRLTSVTYPQALDGELATAPVRHRGEERPLHTCRRRHTCAGAGPSPPGR